MTFPGAVTVNAQQVVEFHRKGGLHAPSALSGTDLTLTAAIEHLVWLRANHNRDDHHAGDVLWDTLQATRWPATDAHDVVNGAIGILVLPPQYELVWLRHVESDLRGSITEGGFTPMTAKAITGAVSEIINNVWQHAQTTNQALLVYRLDPERVHIGVADTGIGVLNSLRTNPRYESIKTSMAALKNAMAVGVSRYEEQGHGYGFDTVLRAVADQWGAVRLRTGQAILEFHATTDLRHATASYGVALPGLQITFSCGTKPPATPITL
jgi:anti-sigma regulatory factor (Ser/Thr protein kinase)